ncbi:MAG: alpha/beta fold hydrolase [Saprospiraceae bacterium]|nr:alpha/beta fold hydrolase [Saprospiraceae bacterium]
MIVKKDVYLLAGLGFDYRVFANLEIQADRIYHIQWERPYRRESYINYVHRLAKKIEYRGRPIVLIGHSFGGITMQEIARILDVEKVIIISSIKSHKERPASFNFLKMLPLHRLVSQRVILGTFPIWGKQHGYKTKEEQQIFKEMLLDSSNRYLRWSIRQVVKWKVKTPLPTELIQIHGTKDKTFPIHLIKNAHTIHDGCHMMVYNRADEISSLINRALRNELPHPNDRKKRNKDKTPIRI